MLCLWCLSTALIFHRRKFWLSQTQIPTACLWRWFCSVGSRTPEIMCVSSIQSPAQILKIWRICTKSGKMSLTVTTDRSTFAFISKLLLLLYMRVCKPFHWLRFEVLQTVNINVKVVWNVKLCIQVNRYRYFQRTWCLHLLDISGTCLHYMASQPISTVVSMITLLRQTIRDLKQFCEPPTVHSRSATGSVVSAVTVQMAVSWDQQNIVYLSMTHIIHNTSALESITITICFKSLM